MIFETTSQPILAILFLFFGFICGFIFDFFNIFKLFFKKIAFFYHFFDFFSILLIFLIFYFINLNFNFGVLRFYSLFIFFGSLIFQRFSLGKTLAKSYERCYYYFNDILKKIKRNKNDKK